MQGKSQVSQEQSTSLACSTIVHAYIIANQLEKALTFLHRIQTEDAGDVETLCLKVFMEDKGSFLPPEHAPLSLRDKLQFLRAMRERLKIHPTRLAYESLLESCAKEKDVRHAADILQMMISDKLAFNVFTYLIILRIFTCARDSERASALVCKMAETMSEKGLEDKHVKFIILKILKGGNMIDKSVSI
ncbi:hypothetical protein KP509_03G064100 [Ceratopteris richardii]|nr:hypothetical protein KP509_03G064100 [Ceratopteris richardii]